MSLNGFYRAFEERFYAPRSVIKELRRQYLSFIQPLSILYPNCPTFDIGCGRGEWLELMQELGMAPFGVDLDEGMLQGCFDLDLPAKQGDAVAHLKTLTDSSQAVITAFHVVEHISFEQLQTVVIEAYRALKPGGLLIMETPNPENIVVATRNFYLDPTHQRPIPPSLLSFLPEFHGYARVGTLRLQENRELRARADTSLLEVLSGVSPDYAVIAQKAATPEMLANFDTAFNAHYGLDLNQLTHRYDSRLAQQLDSLDQRLTLIEGRTNNMAGSQDSLATLIQEKLVDATSQIAIISQQLANARTSELAEAVGSISSLQEKLLDMQMQLARKQAEADQLINQTKHNLQRADVAAAQTLVAKQQTQAQTQRAISAETKALQEEQRAVAAEALAEEYANKVHAILHQFKDLEAKINDLGGDRSHWLQWVKKLNIEHQIHLKNASLCSAKPLKTDSPIRLQLLRSAANFVIRHSINLCQRPISILMAAVLRRPQLSHRINQWLLRYPALHQQLHGVARHSGVIPGDFAIDHITQRPVAPALASLAPRTRHIYAALHAALQKNERHD
ncbi:class I SAM-dependent methyltransferase [Comamonas humi]